MADRMTKEQRHKCMARIKGKDTKPEMIVRRYLHAHGYRYRINVRRLPGTPDIVLRRFRTVIFINGCFWHGHEGCRYFVMPKSNTPFWEKKIERNKQRDVEKRIQLRRMGWHTIIKRVFAHSLRDLEISTIERKMSHTESECRIKIDSKITI